VSENVGNRKPRAYRLRVEFDFLTMLRGVYRKCIFARRLDTRIAPINDERLRLKIDVLHIVHIII